jgi:hypothetical protein
MTKVTSVSRPPAFLVASRNALTSTGSGCTTAGCGLSQLRRLWQVSRLRLCQMSSLSCGNVWAAAGSAAFQLRHLWHLRFPHKLVDLGAHEVG